MTDSGNVDRTLFVNVMLHEYDTLRAEILTRVSSRFQLLGFAGLTLGLLGTSHKWSLIGGIAGGVLVIAVIVWLRFRLYIASCSERLRDIECIINREVGGTPLIWETTRPILRWKDAFKPFPRTTPSSD